MTSPPAPGVVIIAVIPAFHPPRELAKRLERLLDQVYRIVIVDDGSDSLRTLGLADDRIEVVMLNANSGIATALNTGISRARLRGATHILTLDQDSEIPNGYVAAALEVFASNEFRAIPVAAAVPAAVEGIRVTTVRHSDSARDPVQSGQLLSVVAIERIGPFAEALVIDSVDSDYTLRARSHGYDLVTVPGSHLDHNLGDPAPIMLFGKHLTLFGKKRFKRYHPPFRTYYMVRNGLVLWRFHRRGNVRWLLHRTGYMALDVVFNSITSPDRLSQFTAIGHGLKDAVTGRLGRIPHETEQSLRQLAQRHR
jgi:rhamnosyltransferase